MSKKLVVRHPVRALVPSVLAAGLALSTAPTAGQGTITHLNATYRVGTIATNQSDSVDCDFTAALKVADVLNEQWWYYRIDNDPDESPLRDDGSLTQSYSGTHADLNWADVDGRGLIRAHLGLDVVSLGPVNGVVYSRLTLFNISQRSLKLNVFHYADVDVCTSSGNTATGSGATQMITAACTAQSAEFGGNFPAHWFVEARDDSECDLLNAGRLTLPDTGLPFGPGDFTGALQWGETKLEPGGQYTVGSSLHHNPGACGRAMSVNYGTGLPGTYGMPTITTLALPRLGTTAVLGIGNTHPLAYGMLIFGFGRSNIKLGNLTILVLAGPRGTWFDALNVFTDPQGNAVLGIPMPNLTYFCGAQVSWQYVFFDPGVKGPLQFAHTDAVEWTLGS